MIDLKKIEKKEDLKQGMDVLAVGDAGQESLERVDCIDGGAISTVSPIDNSQRSFKYPIDDYIKNRDLYEVKKK